MEDNVWLTVLGGGIAGGIGILTFSYQQWRADQRRLDEQVLVPALNYVNGLLTKWPWDYIQEPEWFQLDFYTRYKLPAKFRSELDRVANLLKHHNEIWMRYSNLLGTTEMESFRESIKGALSRYVTGVAIDGKKMGIESGPILEIDRVLPGFLPHILLNPTNPSRAWDELHRVGSGTTAYWAMLVADALQRSDPKSLKDLFDAVTNNPHSRECRGTAESTLRAFQDTIQEAMLARELLAKRLHIRAALTATSM